MHEQRCQTMRGHIRYKAEKVCELASTPIARLDTPDKK
jgi:hypothetical protein